MKGIIVAVIATLICGWSSFGVSRTPQTGHIPKVKIAVSLTPLSTPLFIAERLGFFVDNGIDVELIPCEGGVNCANLLQNNTVDYATASGTVALFNQHQHNNILILASFVTSSNDIKLLTLDQLKINSLQDLSGKKVGIIKSSASELYFDFLLISNALQELDVERVYLQPHEMVSALLSFQVDAISVWEPYGYKASLLSTTPVIDLGLKGIYQLSFNLLAKSPRTILSSTDKEILSAIYQATQWIENHPSESISLISNELGVNPQQVKWAWGDYIFELTNGYTLLSNLQLQARWASERKIIEGEPIDVRSFIDDAAYRELQTSGVIK